MSLSDNSNMIMPVAPTGSFGGGFGNGFGGDWGWIILLLLFAGGGWGNGFGGGFGGYGNMMLGYDFPWLLNGQNGINANTNNGFQNAMLNDNVTSIRDGIGNLATQLCNSTASVTAAVSNGFANAETAANARQIADMQTAFAGQTAMAQGFNGLQAQLANCCCENRLSNADLKYTIATENCADRAAISDGLRDILVNQTANTQKILDKMCQQEIDVLKSQNLALQNQVNMQNLAASQTAQTATLIADNTAQTQYIVNRVAPYPIPAYTVANPITPAI